MSREDYEYKELSLEDLVEVIKKIENPNDALHKLKDTAIYHSFVFSYNLLKNRENFNE